MEPDGTINVAIVNLNRLSGHQDQLVTAANLYNDNRKVDLIYLYGGRNHEAQMAYGICRIHAVSAEHIIKDQPDLNKFLDSCREGINKIKLITSWLFYFPELIKFRKELRIDYWHITEFRGG